MSIRSNPADGPGDPSPYAPKRVRTGGGGPRRTVPMDYLGDYDESIAESQAGAPEELSPDDRPDESEFARDFDPEPHDDWASEDDRRPEEDLYIDRFRVPPSLGDDDLRQTLRARRSQGRIFGMLGRLALAVSIAAVAALVVAGKFSDGWDLVAGQHPAEAAPAPEQAQRTFDLASVPARQQVPSVPSPREAKEEPVVPSIPPMAATPVPVVLPTAVVPAASVAPVAPEPPGQTAAIPDQAEPARLEPAVIAALIKRADEFVKVGDISAARVLLRRAAESRDSHAAFALAGTYDPIALDRLGVRGAAADLVQARFWYDKAREFGSSEAQGRIEMLATRTR
jgi:hypothetical protein